MSRMVIKQSSASSMKILCQKIILEGSRSGLEWVGSVLDDCQGGETKPGGEIVGSNTAVQRPNVPVHLALGLPRTGPGQHTELRPGYCIGIGLLTC